MLRLAFRAAKSGWAELKVLPLKAAVALGASGLGEPPRPNQLWKAFGIVLPVGFLTWWAIPQATIVMSPSINAWLVREVPGPIARNDLVSFTLSHPLAGPKPVAVTKYALCFPGDQISMIEKPSMSYGEWDGWYYCNGRLLGVSKPFGHNGQRLEHWQPNNGRILPDTIYVGSTHASGFDSRYYGPIPIERLRRMEKLL